MCIFSGPVEKVCSTRIFCRLDDNQTQYLVYEMEFSADNELAMILPFPAKPGTSSQFINLEEDPDFFDKVESVFPQRRSRSRLLKSAPPKLEIKKVGAFEASFVPSINDFHRLDEKFQFARGTLEAMGRLYSGFSFAVFKLRPGKNIVAHPMAFKFNTFLDNYIFFPTLHVHDGQLHEKEKFDHALYVQLPSNFNPLDTRNAKLDNSYKCSEHKLYSEKFASWGVVTNSVVLKKTLKGNHPNKDHCFRLVWNPAD